MSIKKICLGLSLGLFSVGVFAAKVCAYISQESTWDGGVFSVIDQSGYTVATTSFVATGAQGCTDSFTPGNYIIRFNGVIGGKQARLSDGIFGCITDVYKINDTVFTIVFNQGNPPFNNNNHCYPPK